MVLSDVNHEETFLRWQRAQHIDDSIAGGSPLECTLVHSGASVDQNLEGAPDHVGVATSLNRLLQEMEFLKAGRLDFIGEVKC